MNGDATLNGEAPFTPFTPFAPFAPFSHFLNLFLTVIILAVSIRIISSASA